MGLLKFQQKMLPTGSMELSLPHLSPQIFPRCGNWHHCLHAGCRGFTGPVSSAALDKDQLVDKCIVSHICLFVNSFRTIYSYNFFPGCFLRTGLPSSAICFMKVSSSYVFSPSVSSSEQYLSAAHTSQLSRYFGSFVSVSGHICLRIMSSSRLLSAKYLTAFFEAVFG